MSDIKNIQIRKIRDSEIENAIELIMRTFIKYEAPDYTEEGIEDHILMKFINI